MTTKPKRRGRTKLNIPAGKWKVFFNIMDQIEVVTEDYNSQIFGSRGINNTMSAAMRLAIARLFAAAPDLFAACEAAALTMKACPERVQVLAAIKLAKGEA